ncbi:MAG: aminotransferase [Oscillospiraceae bacterium]|nr:aminotransferase [Oscillospiraceae bacterium]
MRLQEKSREELEAFQLDCQKVYEQFQAENLKLDMSRGKPSAAQLELSMGMMDCLKLGDYRAENGLDCRNYGVLDGLPEAKQFFAPMLGVKPEELIVYGNSSLNIMYWVMSVAMTNGVLGGTPWGKLDKVKFLCPVPGYDRHFAVTQFFGMELINIPMHEDGPDMDLVEKLVAEDDSIKGIWCVPMYSNPGGVVYSDEVVKRFAALKPKAADFRIFWDNAYCVHHLVDNPPVQANLLEEAKKAGNEDICYLFASTSKITFPGSGVAVMAASEANIASLKKALGFATIGFDKMNQLRHLRFFDGKFENLVEHMKKHKELIAPKFAIVVNTLEKGLRDLEIANWSNPQGGYFISFNQKGCAKRIVQLCKDAGVVLTGAGASFPYGVDPEDENIRISPTFPTETELQKAMDVFVCSAKLAAAEKLLAE